MIILFLFLCCFSFAANDTSLIITKGLFTYEVNLTMKTAKIIYFQNSNEENLIVEIPSTIRIDDNNSKNIECIVSIIGDKVFYYMGNIISVIWPTNLIKIGSSSFENCKSLKTVSDFPMTLAVIERDAFLNCISLTIQLKLPTYLNRLGTGSFQNCPLKGRIILPPNIEFIGFGPFAYCRSVYEFSFSSPVNSNGESNKFNAVDGVLLSADNNDLIQYPSARAFESYTIPEGVYTIRSLAFTGSQFLKTVYFPKSYLESSTDSFLDSSVQNFVFAKCRKFDITNNVIEKAECIIYPNNNGDCKIESIKKNESSCDRFFESGKDDGSENTAGADGDNHRAEAKRLVTIILPILSVLLAISIVASVLRRRKISVDQLHNNNNNINNNINNINNDIINNGNENCDINGVTLPSMSEYGDSESCGNEVDDIENIIINDEDSSQMMIMTCKSSGNRGGGGVGCDEGASLEKTTIGYEGTLANEVAYPLPLTHNDNDNPYDNITADNLF